jgi:shikimate dehydrogenase
MPTGRGHGTRHPLGGRLSRSIAIGATVRHNAGMPMEPAENTYQSSAQPVLALLGFPIGGNPTQFMLERAFAGQRLDWRYLSLDVRPEDLVAAVQGIRALGFRGGNCTGPHKLAIAGQLDRLTQHAAMVGAVNCFFRDPSGLTGDNTEGRAMLQSLRRKIDPAGKRVVLLGAGAMARAVAVELALAKAAQIVVVNRSEPAGRGLVDLIGSLQTSASLVVWQDDYAVPAETNVLIHATSIPGDQPLPLDLNAIASELVVADVAWETPRTWLLDQAAQRGAKTIDGLEVFIEQAAINFRLWTGVEPERAMLREAAEEFLEV